MKRLSLLLSILSLVIVAGFVISPFIISSVFPTSATVFAANTGLLPSSCAADPKTCSFCDLLSTLQNVFRFARNMGFLLATLYVMYGGWLYLISAGNPGQHTKALATIKHAAYGIIIMLAAWTLVNTLIAALGVKPSASWVQNWNTIQCRAPIPGSAK